MKTTTKTTTKTKPAAKPAPAAEKLPKPTAIDLPTDMLRAAALCAAGKKEQRDYLAGVHVHRVDKRVRVVATNGNLMLIQSFKEPDDLEKCWLDDGGLTIPVENLAPRLAMIDKGSDKAPTARISYARGASKMELADIFAESTFRIPPIGGTFPDYQAIIASSIGAFTDVGDVPPDFEPVAFAGDMFKAVAAVAAALEAKAASVYIARAEIADTGQKTNPGASVVTFLGCPGAVLYIMPMQGDVKLAGENAMILAPAIKGTLAALKANRTRNEVWAKEAKTEAERKILLDKVESFNKRIADIMAKTGPKALPAPEEPKAKPADKPAAKPEAPTCAHGISLLRKCDKCLAAGKEASKAAKPVEKPGKVVPFKRKTLNGAKSHA
jgi:hypothetical protein